MLKLKQDLKTSNLFFRGSVDSEGKMNDERMISQTPTVHKLDEVFSWCLADCSKYVCVCERERESLKKSQWRRVNLISHVGWPFLLLGSEERECVLCHVIWLVLLLASEEARRGRQDRSVLLERSAWKRVKECFLAYPRTEWHEIFSLVENMSSGPKLPIYSCARQ